MPNLGALVTWVVSRSCPALQGVPPENLENGRCELEKNSVGESMHLSNIGAQSVLQTGEQSFLQTGEQSFLQTGERSFLQTGEQSFLQRKTDDDGRKTGLSQSGLSSRALSSISSNSIPSNSISSINTSSQGALRVADRAASSATGAAKEPSITAAEPSITAAEPSITAAEPLITEADLKTYVEEEAWVTYMKQKNPEFRRIFDTVQSPKLLHSALADRQSALNRSASLSGTSLSGIGSKNHASGSIHGAGSTHGATNQNTSCRSHANGSHVINGSTSSERIHKTFDEMEFLSAMEQQLLPEVTKVLGVTLNEWSYIEKIMDMDYESPGKTAAGKDKAPAAGKDKAPKTERHSASSSKQKDTKRAQKDTNSTKDPPNSTQKQRFLIMDWKSVEHQVFFRRGVLQHCLADNMVLLFLAHRALQHIAQIRALPLSHRLTSLEKTKRRRLEEAMALERNYQNEEIQKVIKRIMVRRTLKLLKTEHPQYPILSEKSEADFKSDFKSEKSAPKMKLSQEDIKADEKNAEVVEKLRQGFFVLMAGKFHLISSPDKKEYESAPIARGKLGSSQGGVSLSEMSVEERSRLSNIIIPSFRDIKDPLMIRKYYDPNSAAALSGALSAQAQSAHAAQSAQEINFSQENICDSERNFLKSDFSDLSIGKFFPGEKTNWLHSKGLRPLVNDTRRVLFGLKIENAEKKPWNNDIWTLGGNLLTFLRETEELVGNFGHSDSPLRNNLLLRDLLNNSSLLSSISLPGQGKYTPPIVKRFDEMEFLTPAEQEVFRVMFSQEGVGANEWNGIEWMMSLSTDFHMNTSKEDTCYNSHDVNSNNFDHGKQTGFHHGKWLLSSVDLSDSSFGPAPALRSYDEQVAFLQNVLAAAEGGLEEKQEQFLNKIKITNDGPEKDFLEFQIAEISPLFTDMQKYLYHRALHFSGQIQSWKCDSDTKNSDEMSQMSQAQKKTQKTQNSMDGGTQSCQAKEDSKDPKDKDVTYLFMAQCCEDHAQKQKEAVERKIRETRENELNETVKRHNATLKQRILDPMGLSFTFEAPPDVIRDEPGASGITAGPSGVTAGPSGVTVTNKQRLANNKVKTSGTPTNGLLDLLRKEYKEWRFRDLRGKLSRSEQYRLKALQQEKEAEIVLIEEELEILKKRMSQREDNDSESPLQKRRQSGSSDERAEFLRRRKNKFLNYRNRWKELNYLRKIAITGGADKSKTNKLIDTLKEQEIAKIDELGLGEESDEASTDSDNQADKPNNSKCDNASQPDASQPDASQPDASQPAEIESNKASAKCCRNGEKKREEGKSESRRTLEKKKEEGKKHVSREDRTKVSREDRTKKKEETKKGEASSSEEKGEGSPGEEKGEVSSSEEKADDHTKNKEDADKEDAEAGDVSDERKGSDQTNADEKGDASNADEEGDFTDQVYTKLELFVKYVTSGDWLKDFVVLTTSMVYSSAGSSAGKTNSSAGESGEKRNGNPFLSSPAGLFLGRVVKKMYNSIHSFGSYVLSPIVGPISRLLHPIRNWWSTVAAPRIWKHWDTTRQAFLSVANKAMNTRFGRYVHGIYQNTRAAINPYAERAKNVIKTHSYKLYLQAKTGLVFLTKILQVVVRILIAVPKLIVRGICRYRNLVASFLGGVVTWLFCRFGEKAAEEYVDPVIGWAFKKDTTDAPDRVDSQKKDTTVDPDSSVSQKKDTTAESPDQSASQKKDTPVDPDSSVSQKKDTTANLLTKVRHRKRIHGRS